MRHNRQELVLELALLLRLKAQGAFCRQFGFEARVRFHGTDSRVATDDTQPDRMP
jgi:hypothetical protein